MTPDAAAHLSAIEDFVALAGELRAPVWLRGGWAVDFTLGRVTRPHQDIDWFADAGHAAALIAALANRGYAVVRSDDQQADLVRDGVEHGIAWLLRRGGEALVAGGPWAATAWPSGMLDGPRRELDGVRAPVISAAAQIEIKRLTPTWRPDLPRRAKDTQDVALLQQHLRVPPN